MTQTPQPILGFFREKLDIEEFHFKSPQYEQAYHELIDLLETKGVYVAILMGNGTYDGAGGFSKHWVRVKSGDGYVFEKRGFIHPHVVWVKDRFDGSGIAQINDPELRRICSDKNETYRLLYEFQPRSVLVEHADDAEGVVSELPGEMVAVKALQGNSGKQVFVGKKTDFDIAQFNQPLPWQIQEYIETDGGIPGVVEGRHDFRVVVIDGQPAIATLRTPPVGSYKSNLGYGGEAKIIDASMVPSELVEICRLIDQRLASIGENRFYSADFGLTQYGWRLFELNAMPGTISRDRGEPAVEYQEKVATFMAQAASKNAQKGAI